MPDTLTQGASLRLWTIEPPDLMSVHTEDSPDLRVFLPAADRATGAAFIVCPGGGYVTLADHEGAPVAQWLADHGITAFVLRYRHAFTYKHPFPFRDALRAVRFVRAHASTWHLDAERIGMLGFSAGGHLTSMVATHADDGQPDAIDPIERISSHLNAQILIYPVISRGLDWHVWSNILGANPSEKLVEMFCSEKHVTADTPPAFLVHCIEDQGVPVRNSDLYAASLQQAGVPYTYIREKLGGHGFGLQERWATPCLAWLQNMGWASSTLPT